VLHAQEHAENIGVERRGIAFRGLLRDRAGFAFGASIVHRDIETSEALDRAVDEATDIVFLAHIGLDEFSFGTERCNEATCDEFAIEIRLRAIEISALRVSEANSVAPRHCTKENVTIISKNTDLTITSECSQGISLHNGLVGWIPDLWGARSVQISTAKTQSGTQTGMNSSVLTARPAKNCGSLPLHVGDLVMVRKTR